MSAIETTLAVSQRVGGCSHLTQVIIGADMKISDHLQIVVQHFIEIPVLRAGLGQNHRQMKADCADIETSHENRLIIFIRRLHAASLIPGT